ncbi:glycosyltransferase family 52 protein [Rossellomorea sp. KS-H15a]|uniref:glycosyltransferase family 52 protein n=1 Tax=Rossellomorea sp. KS-H15a TaxID=2963940 RepID=UPI0020C62701|nr:glycosyltransferase family 52 protein [Rossellomorea sp. KS-H15a]UTE77502.1 glycosyltransferase family 52 protein [Rossellomorea sp. KS-H15a]
MIKNKIFICLTPFNTLYVQEIVKQQREEGIEGKFLLFTRSTQGVTEELWDQISYLNPYEKSNNNDLNYYKKMILDAKKLYRVVSEIINFGSETEIYFSNLDSLYTNYLFFKNKKDKKISFHSIQDGTMNIVSRKVNYAMFKRQIIKSFYAMFLGFRFIPFIGCLNGIDRKEMQSQILLFIPKTHSSKTNLIHFEKVESSSKIKEISREPYSLLLGAEPLLELIDQKSYYSILRGLITRIRRDFPYLETLYYKPHPFHNPQSKNKTFEYIKSHIPNLKIIELNGQETVETLDFRKLNIKALYSINSSASVNLKLLNKDLLELVRIAGLDIIYKNKQELNNFKMFYRSLGISVINEEGEIEQ